MRLNIILLSLCLSLLPMTLFAQENSAVEPLNKNIWTDSKIIIVGAGALLSGAVSYIIIDNILVESVSYEVNQGLYVSDLSEHSGIKSLIGVTGALLGTVATSQTYNTIENSQVVKYIDVTVSSIKNYNLSYDINLIIDHVVSMSNSFYEESVVWKQYYFNK